MSVLALYGWPLPHGVSPTNLIEEVSPAFRSIFEGSEACPAGTERVYCLHDDHLKWATSLRSMRGPLKGGKAGWIALAKRKHRDATRPPDRTVLSLTACIGVLHIPCPFPDIAEVERVHTSWWKTLKFKPLRDYLGVAEPLNWPGSE